MSYRTTFALDGITIDRLRKISIAWHISQAEVVRRAVERMEKELDSSRRDPLELLTEFHGRGGLEGGKAREYLEEVAERRLEWRGEE